MVPAHTTWASERPACCGAARSVAANRACRLTAVPAPMDSSPRNSGTTRSAWAAATSSALPTAAVHHPAVRAARRPYRAARFPSGRPSRAAPRMLAVRARPAQASLPVTSPASSTPIEGAMPTPTVPMACMTVSTVIVRRCTRAASGGGACRTAPAAGRAPSMGRNPRDRGTDVRRPRDTVAGRRGLIPSWPGASRARDAGPGRTWGRRRDAVRRPAAGVRHRTGSRQGR